MTMITAEDRAIGQHLPDEFLALSGEARDRLVELVTRHWESHGAKPRAQLVEALLPMFTHLLESGEPITEDMRDLCEGLISAWLYRQP